MSDEIRMRPAFCPLTQATCEADFCACAVEVGHGHLVCGLASAEGGRRRAVRIEGDGLLPLQRLSLDGKGALYV